MQNINRVREDAVDVIDCLRLQMQNRRVGNCWHRQYSDCNVMELDGGTK